MLFRWCCCWWTAIFARPIRRDPFPIHVFWVGDNEAKAEWTMVAEKAFRRYGLIIDDDDDDVDVDQVHQSGKMDWKGGRKAGKRKTLAIIANTLYDWKAELHSGKERENRVQMKWTDRAEQRKRHTWQFSTCVKCRQAKLPQLQMQNLTTHTQTHIQCKMWSPQTLKKFSTVEDYPTLPTSLQFHWNSSSRHYSSHPQPISFAIHFASSKSSCSSTFQSFQHKFTRLKTQFSAENFFLPVCRTVEEHSTFYSYPCDCRWCWWYSFSH